MSVTPRLVAIPILLAALAAPGFAGQFSFAGTFTLLSGTTVTLQSLGYGGSANNLGGTNANGQVISPGGFETVMQVYYDPSGEAVGLPIQPGESNNCPPR